MSSIFISYSRKDIEFARRLTEAFKSQDLDFWIDWQGIPPTVDWWKEIEKGIEEADAFLFLISPDSIKSKVCSQEIECAVHNGKRLIPVVVRDVNVDEAPPSLAHLNWIFCRDGDNFDVSIEKLLTSLHTDFEWLQNHRRLQVKALEWERKHKENSFLLRGRDLQDAESQLSLNSSREPFPTDLQREYVLRSRQISDRQTRTITAVSIGGVIALAALALYGFIQAGLANTNAKEANDQAIKAQAASIIASNNAATAQANEKEAQQQALINRTEELSAQVELNTDSSPSRALLMAIEAMYSSESPNAATNPAVKQAMYDAYRNIEGDPLPGSTDTVRSMQFTEDGRWLLTESDFNVQAWKVGQTWGSPYRINNVNLKEVTKSGRILLALDINLEIWDFSTETPRQILQFTFDNGYVFKEALGTGEYKDQNGFVSDYAISDNGRWFAICNVNKTISIFDLDFPQKEPFVFDAPYDVEQGQKLNFSPKGNWLVVESMLDNSSYLYRMEFDTSGSLVNIKQEKYLRLTFYQGINIPSIQFSPDGNWMLLSDAQVELWNIGSKQEPDKQIISATTIAAQFSDNNKYLYSSDDIQTTIWFLPEQLSGSNSLERVSTLPAPYGLVFSPDGRTVLLHGKDALYWWDSQTRAIYGSQRIESYIGQVEFLANSSGLLVLTWDGQIVQFSQNFGTTRTLGTYPEIYSFAFAELKNLIVVMDKANKIHILDMNRSSPLPLERFVTSESYDSYLVSSDGRWLIAGSNSDLVPRIWDLENLISEIRENTIQIFPGGQDASGLNVFDGYNPSPNFVISPNGRWLANISDKQGVLYDLTGSIDSPVLLGKFVLSLTFSPDSHWLGVYTVDHGGFEFWNLELSTPSIEEFYPSPTGWAETIQLEFSPDGKWLITNTPWQVFILNWQSRKMQNWLVMGAEPPTGQGGGGGGGGDFRPGDNLVFSPDGKWLAFGKNASGMENEDKFPRGRYLLELDSVLDYPLRLQDSLLDFNTNNMLFSNDGRWLVSVPFGRGIAFLTDVSGSSPGSTFIELTGNRRLISAIAFSPDNHWLATGHGNQIYLWDLTSMDPSASPRVIQGHTNTIWSLAFSPNGQTLASGSRDKTIRLWDMNARNITTSAIILNGHTAEVYDIAFTDNGSRLISNSLDGTTRIWNLDFEEMVAQACEEAGRNFTEDEWALYFEGEPYHKTCQK